MKVTLREAGADDAGAVISLWQECGLTRPWNDPQQDFNLSISSPGSTILIAETAEQLAGTVMIGFDGHRGWIYYLGTGKRYRGRGWAKKLIEAAQDWLMARGCPKVELMVRDDNPASGLYEHLDWELQPVKVYARWLRKSDM